MAQQTGEESIQRKMEKAADNARKAHEHEERAEDLGSEVEDEVRSIVESSLDFNSQVEVTCHEERESITIHVYPFGIMETLEEGLPGEFESGLTSPFTITIGEEVNPDSTQRERIKNIKAVIDDLEDEYDEGAPVNIVIKRAAMVGLDHSEAEREIDKLKQKGEVYEPQTDHLRTT